MYTGNGGHEKGERYEEGYLRWQSNTEYLATASLQKTLPEEAE